MVTVTSSKSNTKTTSITKINIYDQQGNLKLHQKYGKVEKAVVQLSGLTTGVYFIEIVDGMNRERQQLNVLK